VDSRQTCTVCRIDVNIGTGGPKNFETHLASKKHLMNVKAAEDASKARQPTLISDFFVKQRAHPASSYQSLPTPQLLASKSPLSSPAFPSSPLSPRYQSHAVTVPSTEDTDVIDMDDTISYPESCHQTGPSTSHPLVTRLRTISMRLPDSVPIGQDTEPFAMFSGDPRDSIVAEDDPWENVIDPSLNRVIGFGTSTRQIADMIRRGPLGIDGFCRWIEICMVELKISPELLEMRLERVFDALKLLYVSLTSIIAMLLLTNL
jgi:hypothetical protein